MQFDSLINLSQTCRHERIVKMIRDQGFVTTEELVTTFRVTPQTIRRDLNYLDHQGLICRHHGGAGEPSNSTVNTAYNKRQQMQNVEKNRIAEKLAEKIPDEASLFINIGTSTEAVARKLLSHNRLKVITNNLHVASILLPKEDFTVIIAGGEVRNRDGGIIGEATRDFIGQFRVDYAVMGISGIDLDGSLLDYDYHEIRVSQAMIANACYRFLTADHSKIGRNAMMRLGHIKDIDTLFTDASLPKPLQETLTRYQTEWVAC
ncbi:MAG: DeoR/GlpR family transcriptional regulator [Endozoicomonas sp. (ex Botrylloides leachii)]|nr:DeoR/GlpR family transcriptional regulator [Endozoicomonas sp. (ex Botrylloides leachii)]